MTDKQRLNIVIYRTGGIGDVILSTVSLSYINRLNINCNVYWISFNPILDFLHACHPKLKPVLIERNKTYSENIRNIKSEIPKADVIIDLQRSMRSILLCRLLAISLKAKYFTWNKGSIRRTLMVLKSKFNDRKKIDSNFLENPYPRFKDMLACTARALSSYSEVEFNAYPKLSVPEINHAHINNLSSDRFWVGIGAGGLHDIKWAPQELFNKILNKLTANTNKKLGFVFLGDEYDRQYSEAIINTLNNHSKAVNYCGKLSLSETAYILDKCSIFLGNDTALAHMAEALGKNTAMLYGPTVEAFGYVPFREGSRSFSSKLGCRPCTKSGNTSCRYNDKLCFEKIDKQKVILFLTQEINSAKL